MISSYCPDSKTYNSTQKDSNIDYGNLQYYNAVVNLKNNRNTIIENSQQLVCLVKGFLIIADVMRHSIKQFEVNFWNLQSERITTSNSKLDQYSLLVTDPSRQNQVTLLFLTRDDYEQFLPQIKKLCIIVDQRLEDKYQFRKRIGCGNQAKVDIYQQNIPQGKSFAVKKYKAKSQCSSSESDEEDCAGSVFNEIRFLQEFDYCENIITLEEIYKNPKGEIQIVMELAQHGTLSNLIMSDAEIQEKDIQVIIEQLLLTLDLMHQSKVIHRDIKPENILILQKREYKVAFADLGMACSLDDENQIKMRCGTPGFVDPDVLKNHGFKIQSDIFSLGVVLYNLLTKQVLFTGNTIYEIILNNKQVNPLRFVDMYCSHASTECIDLLKKMLNANQQLRPTAEQCLKHQWFKKNHESINKILQINKNAFQNLIYTPLSPPENNQIQSFVMGPNYYQNLKSQSQNLSLYQNSFQHNPRKSSSNSPIRFSYNQLLKDFKSKECTDGFTLKLDSLVPSSNPQILRRATLQNPGKPQPLKQLINKPQNEFSFASSNNNEFDDFELEEYQTSSEIIINRVNDRLHLCDLQTEDRQLSIRNKRNLLILFDQKFL